MWDSKSVARLVAAGSSRDEYMRRTSTNSPPFKTSWAPGPPAQCQSPDGKEKNGVEVTDVGNGGIESAEPSK